MFSGSFLSGVGMCLSVWHALLIRETRSRFGVRYLGYFWALIEPVIWILSFQLIFAFMERKAPYDMSVIEFILTGIVPFSMLRNMVGRVSKGVEANRALLYYPQVHVLDICVSRVWLELLTMLGVLTALWGGYALAGEGMYIDDLLQVILGLGAVACLGMGLGMLVMTLSQFSPSAGVLVNVLFRPLFFLSGIFYPVEHLPDVAQDFLWYNPILHIIQYIRSGWSPTYQAEEVDMFYVSVWCIVTLAMGVHLVRTVVRQRIEFS